MSKLVHTAKISIFVPDPCTNEHRHRLSFLYTEPRAALGRTSIRVWEKTVNAQSYVVQETAPRNPHFSFATTVPKGLMYERINELCEQLSFYLRP